jgi:hypothetical protein
MITEQYLALTGEQPKQGAHENLDGCIKRIACDFQFYKSEAAVRQTVDEIDGLPLVARAPAICIPVSRERLAGCRRDPRSPYHRPRALVQVARAFGMLRRAACPIAA